MFRLRNKKIIFWYTLLTKGLDEPLQIGSDEPEPVQIRNKARSFAAHEHKVCKIKMKAQITDLTPGPTNMNLCIYKLKA